MRFERGKDPKTQMGIGIIEKYRGVLNEIGKKYSTVILLGGEVWEDIEKEIEREMDWERGTVKITRLKDKNGVSIAVTNKEVRDEIRKREKSQKEHRDRS